MTSQLRSRLMQQMNAEPEARQWMVLSRCGAGLAIVVLIAFIGISADERRDDNAAARVAVQSVPTPEAHRREVFEQRRITFEQAQRGRVAKQQLSAHATGSVQVE